MKIISNCIENICSYSGVITSSTLITITPIGDWRSSWQPWLCELFVWKVQSNCTQSIHIDCVAMKIFFFLHFFFLQFCPAWYVLTVHIFLLARCVPNIIFFLLFISLFSSHFLSSLAVLAHWSYCPSTIFWECDGSTKSRIPLYFLWLHKAR